MKKLSKKRKITRTSRKPQKRVALKMWHVPFVVVAAVAVTASLFLFLGRGETADGSGTNSVAPTSVNRASTGNTLTFTFTGAETMDSGGVNIFVPSSSGWSTPQGSSGTVGFTTVTASGNATIADVLNNADSVTGWTEDDNDACNTTPPTSGFGLDTTTFKEGTGSITCNNSGSNAADAGDSFGFDFTVQNWSAYTQAGFWIRSSAAVSTGNIQVAIDNATNCGSPIEEMSLPSLTANTWTYVKWTFAGAGSTRTSVATFCLNAQTNGGLDNTQIYVDDILIGPGSPTFPANGSDTDIAVRLVDLAASETLTVTYGSGGGISGATAPDAAAVYTFTTRTRTSSSGSLTGISSSPTVTVNNPVPTTTSISPTSKTVGDSQFTMTVNGTNFNSNSVVRFSGSDRTTSFVNSTQVTATIPASDLTTAGTFSITVFNATPGGGTSNAQTFTVNNPVPTTTSISPTSKTVGDSGFTMTVNGTNFVSSSVVRFNGSNRTTAYVSATQLTATIPSSDLTTEGTFSITVFNTTPGGGTSNAQTFTVSAAANPVPTTTSISPSSKTVGDSQFTMTVNGTNFVSSSVVRLDGSNRTTTFVNSTQLTATIPASDMTTAGTFSITVFNTTPGGGTSNAQTFTVNNPVPTTTSIDPNSKQVGDAQFTMTVNGTNFVSSSVVRLDGSNRATTYVSATQLTATIPASDMTTAGTFSIIVFNTTPGGGTSNAQTFTVSAAPNPVPTTTSISPTSKTVGDSQFTMTVNGTNFVTSSLVKLDGSTRTTTYVSATQLTATILTSDMTTAGTFSITVFNPTPGGGTSNTQTFTVNNPVPTTTSISPTSATEGDSGFTMTVNGTNFVSSSVVRFDGSNRTTTYVSATQLTASILTSDLTTAGTFSITVFNTTPGGGTSNAQTFTVSPPSPGTATKFVILDPADSTVGTATTVTVRAHKADDTVDTNYQNDVTLVASGSATGEGLVDIVNGVGTKSINDSVAETVTLSLSDTQGTGLNVDSTQQVIFSAAAGAPAAEAEEERAQEITTNVHFAGRAFPGANIVLVARQAATEINLQQDTVASGSGVFDIQFTGKFSGLYSYGLLVYDPEKRVSHSRFYTFDVNLGSLVELDILIPPTLGFLRPSVRRGDNLVVVGYATPDSVVRIQVDGRPISGDIFTAADGSYKAQINTANLDYGRHTIRARQTDNRGKTSDFTSTKVFGVSKLFFPKTDLNGDGIINISDWSIFLSRWLSKDKLIDLNSDGKVDISDFSIFIRTFRTR